MATLALKARSRTSDYVELQFDSFRNITSAEDKSRNRKIFTGQIPARACLDLSTDENVRGYLLEAEGKLRKRQTLVHKAILDTLKNDPADFAVLNGGLVMVARDCEVDESRKVMKLLRPSIINGSQTQGCLKDFYEECEKDGIEPESIFISFQLLITDDEDLIAETSIARNYQNDVKDLSIYGRRGRFDELEKAIGQKLQKDETDLTGIPTEKLLQVLVALMPDELWRRFKPTEKDEPNKVYTYSMKAKCLKEFDDIFKRKEAADADAAEIYKYFLDTSDSAWSLYQKWKNHQGFQGTGIKNALAREEDGRTIKEVQDGMIFPILSALSAFVDKYNGRWEIRTPAHFDDKDLIKTAVQAYMKIAGSNPWNMGKDKGCYSMCLTVTSLYKKYAAAV